MKEILVLMLNSKKSVLNSVIIRVIVPYCSYFDEIGCLFAFGFIEFYGISSVIFKVKYSLYIYVMHSISFQTFFVQAFKTVVDS